MALTPRLELRATQSLVMTPQLMQAIKLLQLSNLDLSAYVEAELERNPLLERDEENDGYEGVRETRDSDGDSGDARSQRDSEAASGEAVGTGVDSSSGDTDGSDQVETSEVLAAGLDDSAEKVTGELDVDLGDVYPDDPAVIPDPGSLAGDPWMTSSGRGGGGEDYDLEAFATSAISLRDHLAEQLAMVIHDPARRLIGLFLIDSLDEAGYLRIDLETVAERLGSDVEEVEAVLAEVQSLEPAGIAARSLAECLALQLQARDRYDPAMQAMIAHLDLLAKRDFPALKRLCGIDDEDLGDMVAEIRRLDPKPGNAFGNEVLQPVVPDVLVRPASNGGWRIELNTDTLPRVLLNQTYAADVTLGSGDAKTRAYLNECLQTANWLIKSLDQRAKTILKVSTEIVRQQDAFLVHGIQHLRPLNLRTVAEAIGMHESTVSRVTSNKYMATTRGIFELKYFFTSAIASAEGGDAHSAEAVRHRIRQLIDEENPRKILSDDTIVKILRESGIDIARRTVAKYREAMRIPSSVQRRREKRAMVRT
ncbi:MAG: RNA polymerase sigma-54 factor [Hyphomicrobiales bacterium]|nr:MAG: RNA polymerase sigma-54 factor [Hyphomicrobiales bacterium]